MKHHAIPAQIASLERPDAALWTYYLLAALATGPGLIIALPYRYFRYHTLRYRFDEEGIHMKVGILFRREVNLTYSRIQDIHLRSNFVERWLGLANIQVQTASGSSGPELVIEGFKNFEEIRDFLYTRMRGYHDAVRGTAKGTVAAPGQVAFTAPATDSEVLQLLEGIRDELRKARQLLEHGRKTEDRA